MASNRKPVSVQYKHYSETKDALGGSSLTDAILRAINTERPEGKLAEHPRHRHYLADHSFGTIVLNYIDVIENAFFGELVRFEAGAQLSLLKVDHVNGNSYNLLQQHAPDGHEAVKGILYFLTLKNHVFVIEQDLSTRRLEQYLTWALSKATNSFPTVASFGVPLEAKLQLDGRPMRLANVTDAAIKPAPITKNHLQQPSIPEEEEVSVSRLDVLRVLVAAGMDSTDIMSLVDQNTDIEVSIHIKFKQSRLKTLVAADKAERLFRNIDTDWLTLTGPGGQEKDGKLTRLAHPTEVKKIGSLLDPTDVARALFEAYDTFVANRFIKP